MRSARYPDQDPIKGGPSPAGTLVKGDSNQVFKHILGNLPVMTVLDIATGQGGFINILLECYPENSQTVGVDIKFALLVEAQAEYGAKKVDFSQMDAALMGFSGGSFDLVNSSVSLHHMLDIPGVIKEMHRVLKPDGFCVFSEMYQDGQTDRQLSEVHLHHWVAEIDSALGITHNQTLTRDEIMHCVSAPDWKSLTCYDYNNPGFDDRQEQIVQQIDSSITRHIQRAEVLPNYEQLRGRGEWIREWIHKNGAQRATVLIIVCQK